MGRDAIAKKGKCCWTERLVHVAIAKNMELILVKHQKATTVKKGQEGCSFCKGRVKLDNSQRPDSWRGSVGLGTWGGLWVGLHS